MLQGGDGPLPRVPSRVLFAGTFPLRAGRWPIPPGLLGAVRQEGWGSGRGWSWCPSSCCLQVQGPPESLGVGRAGVPPTGLFQFLSALITIAAAPHSICHPHPSPGPWEDRGQPRLGGCGSWSSFGGGGEGGMTPNPGQKEVMGEAGKCSFLPAVPTSLGLSTRCKGISLARLQVRKPRPREVRGQAMPSAGARAGTRSTRVLCQCQPSATHTRVLSQPFVAGKPRPREVRHFLKVTSF